MIADQPVDIPQRMAATPLGMLVPRALAHVVDTALLIGLYKALQRLTGLGAEGGDAVFLLGCSVALAYFIVCEWRWGRTLGKRVLGLRVVTREGRRISLGQSLGRNALRPVEASLGPICLLGAVFILLTKSSQRLGDLAADTFVVPETLLK